MDYRFEATSVTGFVQQLAVGYLPYGYWFYVTGVVPMGKDPAAVDRKLLTRYGVAMSRWERCRRRKEGIASIQYLRFQRFFVLLATHGQHPFFQEEAQVLRDVRRVPIRFAGYAISYRGGHPHVRIDRTDYLWLKERYLDKARRWSVEQWREEFARLPYEPYAPVRRQLLNLLRAINRKREKARQELLPTDCLRLRRRIVRPFG